MMKRILAGAAATGFAITLFAGGPAQAAACNEGSNLENADTVQELPSGSTIYGAQTSDTGGFVGITGDNGYLEAGGDAANGGYVEGEAPAAGVNGRLDINEDAALCLSPVTD